MSIQIIKVDELEKWDSIVKSFKEYDVYYLNGYAKACKVNGDGEPLLVYFDSGDTRAINVVIKRDIADDKNFRGLIEKGEYYDIVTPYGYGGFIVEGEDVEALESEYVKLCRHEKIISEFVRFHPVLKNSKRIDEIYITKWLGNTVSIELSDKDDIWNNIESKNRNCIRKADKNNIKIHKGNGIEEINNFIELYEKTMNYLKADEMYYFKREYYETFARELKDNSIIFYAKLEDKIIAASLILFANDKIHYHLSASLKEYNNISPTNLLIYEVALHGLNKNLKKFHLGGGVGSQRDNLYKFKKSFYKEDDNDFVIGKKIFDDEKYKYLLQKRRLEETGKDYFPEYRKS